MMGFKITAKSGISMTEYALCGGICILLAIPALSGLENVLQNRFSSMEIKTSSAPAAQASAIVEAAFVNTPVPQATQTGR